MPFISIFIFVLIFCLHLLPNSFELLAFHRSEVINGAWWQLLTADFVHGSWEHLVRDGAALLCLGPVVEYRIGRNYYLFFVVFSSICISLAYFMFMPKVQLLFGISGVIAGLFGVLLTLELPKAWKRHSWVLFGIILLSLVGFSLKLGYEFIFDKSLLFRKDLGAAPLAHFSGLLAGVVLGMAASFRKAKMVASIPRLSIYISMFGALSWVAAVLFWPN